ncbi:MAG: radical SAM protein [Candidatus Korarchaeota archaeon]|nr:radical SAM protein [Candidatus Korarchaeota archaeon]
MRVLRPFDPWKSPLCTCPPQLTLNPYTGCGHRCAYCYITAYVRDAFNPKPKRDLIARLISDLKRLRPGTLVSMSLSSDPYTPPEGELGLTRRALDLLLRAGAKVLVVTKSSLVARDADVLSRGRAAVMFTVTTPSEDVASRLEPGAPSPGDRFKAMASLTAAGVPVGLRLDPIIPGVNDSPEGIREILRSARDAGASHVVSSTYKARPDSMKRLLQTLPEAAEALRSAYRGGERFGGYVYLPRSERIRLMEIVRREALELGMTFATCREGLHHMNTPGVACDGSHLTLAGRHPGVAEKGY